MRHAVFIGLVGTYVLTVLYAHGTFPIDLGRLTMMYVVSSWCACYWQGPYTRGVLDPYRVAGRVISLDGHLFPGIRPNWLHGEQGLQKDRRGEPSGGKCGSQGA